MSISAGFTIMPLHYTWKKDNLFRYHAHHIVFIDDHKIFREGIKRACLKDHFPNARLIEFAEGNEAFMYVARHLEGKQPAIDLIITDIRHPGFDGLTFIPLLRHLEKLKGRGNSIPIVVITMYDAEVFRNRLAPLINSYMQKSDSAAEIIYELQKILL